MAKTLSSNHILKGLYAITDEQLTPENKFAFMVEQALQGGANIIQYRDKSANNSKRLQQASQLQSLCTQYNATCIINDDIELALAVDADGVHLGKADDSISQAREILGKNKIIGISCYNKLKLATEAEKHSADYVAFGAMFASPTKPEANKTSPELISQAKNVINIPICAIGGINEKNITQVVLHGADMAAVISSLFSSDNIQSSARILSGKFV